MQPWENVTSISTGQKTSDREMECALLFGNAPDAQWEKINDDRGEASRLVINDIKKFADILRAGQAELINVTTNKRVNMKSSRAWHTKSRWILRMAVFTSRKCAGTTLALAASLEI